MHCRAGSIQSNAYANELYYTVWIAHYSSVVIHICKLAVLQSMDYTLQSMDCALQRSILTLHSVIMHMQMSCITECGLHTSEHGLCIAEHGIISVWFIVMLYHTAQYVLSIADY